MLVLIKKNEYVSCHSESSRIDIDGIVIMPSKAGWTHGDYSLHEIHQAAPVPDGKRVESTGVENVDGKWAYVNILEDIQTLTPEEMRTNMPSLTPREFRDALLDSDILPDDVTAAIQTIPFDKEREKALNAWLFPTEFTRTDPYIEMIAAMFSLTPNDIDDMWNEALATR